MDSNAFFSGSAYAQYKPTSKVELGYGSSNYHSITAMEEYECLSTEEIRLEDYNASGGLFGSSIAKIGGALCVGAKYKLRPYQYGELYRSAIGSGKIQPVNTPLDNNVCTPAPIKMENQYQKSNGVNVTIGSEYTRISINGPCVNGISLLVKHKLTVQEDGEVEVTNEDKKGKYGKNFSCSGDTRHLSPTSKMKNISSTERKEFKSDTYKKSISKESKIYKTSSHVPLRKTSDESKKKPETNKERASKRQRK